MAAYPRCHFREPDPGAQRCTHVATHAVLPVAPDAWGIYDAVSRGRSARPAYCYGHSLAEAQARTWAAEETVEA